MESLQEMQDSDLFPVTSSMVWGPASIPNQSSRLVPLSTQFSSAQIRQEAREFIEQNMSEPGPVQADGIVREHTNEGTRLVPLKLKQMNTLGKKVLQESNIGFITQAQRRNGLHTNLHNDVQTMDFSQHLFPC